MAHRPHDTAPGEATRRLSGRVLLVTGGSSGIGRAIALAAAREGADVALTFHRNEPGAPETAEAVARLGRAATVLHLDLADAAQIDHLACIAWERLGRVDAWVNNAGADVLTGDGAMAPRLEKLDRLLAVDLRGTILCSWAAATRMREQPGGGVIVNVSWDHAITGMPGTNPQMFSAVKGGILSFSKSLARTVAPHVRVNVLAPGWIETAFGADLEDGRHRAVAESTPLGRWGTPEDVAHAAMFLVAPDSAFLTGQTLFVNGGIVM